jgi:AbrB family looped-hinge helix DNA binding protein
MKEVPFRTKVGPRGRITIPVAVQRAAGIQPGEEVILCAAGDGSITIRTRQAIIDGIRAGIPATAPEDDSAAPEA